MSDGTTLDVWLRFLAIVVTQLVVGLGIWSNLRNKADKASVENVGEIAQHAADNAAPTANGYAGKTMSALTRIEGSVIDTGRRLDRIETELGDVRGYVTRHIESHADAEVRRQREKS